VKGGRRESSYREASYYNEINFLKGGSEVKPSVKGTVMLFLVFLLLVPALTSAEPAFSRIVAFGTSLSDSGNDFAMRGVANVPPYDRLDPLLIPDDPYAKGGHHFSNGATWVEYLGRSIGLAGSVLPAFQSSSSKPSDYAVKGARAHPDGINFNLSAQVNAFLNDFGGAAPSDALYVIEIGANDIRDSLAVFASGGDGSAILTEALTTVAANIQTLYAAGARKFLVWRMPNIGLTPALRILDGLSPGASLAAGHLTQSYNAGLDSVLAILGALPGIQFKRLDAYQILGNITADPAAYGLAVVDTACVTPNVAPYACQNPDEYAFWDGIHPTTAVHAILAREARVALGQ
jgi:phospholipase/lecithinase/hemolysin